MAYKLKDFLKDWYKAYHFHMMPAQIRAQIIKLQSDENYDVVTAETQEQYRDFVRNQITVGQTYTIKAQPGNLDELRRISGNPNMQAGDEYDYNVVDNAAREEYLRVFSPKLGDRFYWDGMLSGGQASWLDKKTGNLAESPLPDISKLSKPEQEHFYRVVRTALREINDDPAEFPDPDNPPKVAVFLGRGKAFREFEIQSVPGMNATEADSRLKRFAALADSNDLLKTKLNMALASYFGAEYSADDFLSDLQETKIRPRALAKLKTVLTIIDGWKDDWTVSAAIRNQLYGIFGNTADIELLTSAVNQENEAIDPILFAQFLNPNSPHGYLELLKSMYDTSKEGKKSAFNSQFESHHGTEITHPLSLVVNNFNYDKLDGEYKDQLTWWQQKKKDWEDFLEDHVQKFWKRHLRHNYIEPAAKGVVNAIVKLEISPEKGLGEILKQKAAIKKIIAQSGANGEKGFDFLCEVLEKIDNSKKMKKAFAGALKNGKQAEKIAKEIIKAAVQHQPPKMGEACVALETLAVMRYDIFSSARGGELDKVLASADFFKDSSFMKVEGVKQVVGFAQKTFNLGMRGLAKLAIMGRNVFQHSRGKISDADADELTTFMDKIQENTESFNTYEGSKAKLDVAKTNWSNFNAAHQAAAQAAGAADVETYIQTLEQQNAADKARIDSLREEIDAASPANIAKYNRLIIEGNDFIATGVADFTDEFDMEFNNYLNGLGPNARLGASYQTLMPGFVQYCTRRALGLTPAQITAKNNEITQKSADIDTRNTTLDTIRPDYIKYKAELNIAQDVFDFQKKKKGDRLEVMTDHKPADDPLNEQQNARRLAWFWNAANGYDFSLNINDYNPFKAHKMESQKLAFNAQVNQRLGMVA